VGGWRQVLQLLAGEDVDGDHVDLGVTVLARLRGGHLDDLARAALDDDVAVLPQRGTLHGERGRGTGVGALEGVLMLCVISSVRDELVVSMADMLEAQVVCCASAHATPPW